MRKSQWFAVGLLGHILSTCPAAASEPRTIVDNEPLVMRIIFDDCLGFVQKDRAPFEGLALLPITARGKEMLRARYTDYGAIHHLFSSRYVVAWGEDSEDRYCIILSSRPSDEPMMLGVERSGFLDRLTQRADSVGMTENDMPGEFSPLNTMSWRKPEKHGKTGLRMVVMPTDGLDDPKMVDAGIIIVAASSNRSND